MAEVTYTKNGKLVDADGIPIDESKEPKVFEVTYNVGGVERYPDGSLVDRSPVSRDDLKTGAPNSADAVTDRIMLTGEKPLNWMSPGELAMAAQERVQAEDDRELIPEDRQFLRANIQDEVQAEHLQNQADNGAVDTAVTPPPTDAQAQSIAARDYAADEAGGQELTPAQKAARTRAANAAAKKAEEEKAAGGEGSGEASGESTGENSGAAE